MEDERIDLSRMCLDEKEEKWIKHYGSRQKILLVGEGDFSFAACLARAFGSADNMVATSLDSRKDLERKYKNAISNIGELESLGCIILQEIDAHRMASDLDLKCFDRIVFNFRHSGFYYCIREDDEDVIRNHRMLMRGFFKNARSMVAKTGEIHVTHKTSYPYNMWETTKLAKDYGLKLVEKAPFFIHDYPGYTNKRGGSPGGYYRCDSKFPIGNCMTYKFSLASQCCWEGVNRTYIDVDTIADEYFERSFPIGNCMTYQFSLASQCCWEGVNRTYIDVDTIADEYFERSIRQKPGKRAGIKSLYKRVTWP